MARHRSICSIVGCLVLTAYVAELPSEAAERQKVAEGEYLMVTKVEAGVKGKTESFEIREVWTLWRTQEGHYEVESEVRWRENGVDITQPPVQYEARLSPDLHPTWVRFSRGAVPGSGRAGDVTLEFGEHELRWSATGGRNGKEESAKLEIEAPYDEAHPLPWFLASIAARAAREKGHSTPVKLVFMDDDHPIDLSAFDGQVIYRGEEEIVAGGKKYRAEAFEVQPDPFPRILVWLAPEGIMLAMQDAKKAEQRMELVRYEKYAEFGPGK